jgi:hypothetical protein
MEYSVLSYLSFRLSTEKWGYICRFELFILYLFQWLGWKSQIGNIQFSSYMFVAYQQWFIRVFDVDTRDQ